MLCNNLLSYRILVLGDNPVSKLYLALLSNSKLVQFEFFVECFVIESTLIRWQDSYYFNAAYN